MRRSKPSDKDGILTWMPRTEYDARMSLISMSGRSDGGVEWQILKRQYDGSSTIRCDKTLP